MIKTIIFDIGRVLVDWNWEEYLNNLFDEDTAKAVGKSFFAHPSFPEFDRGVWSTEEVLERFISDAPQLKEEILYTFQRMGETIVPRETAIPWIKELKERGYQVLFLSNYCVPMLDKTRGKLEFLKYMDGGIFSCDVKMIKPDPDIYKCILDKYNLIPEECIFIDDMAENIAAAKSLGINAIQYLSYNQVREEMEKLL